MALYNTDTRHASCLQDLPSFFTILTEQNQVSFGSALHVMGDIDHWASMKRKRAEAEEDREDQSRRRG